MRPEAISVRWLWAWISETAVPWMRWPRYWNNLKASGVAYQILYLEASDEVLVKTIQGDEACPSPGQTGPGGGWYPPQEREKLLYLKENATYILDTSQLLTRELEEGPGTDPGRKKRTSRI